MGHVTPRARHGEGAAFAHLSEELGADKEARRRSQEVAEEARPVWGGSGTHGEVTVDDAALLGRDLEGGGRARATMAGGAAALLSPAHLFR